MEEVKSLPVETLSMMQRLLPVLHATIATRPVAHAHNTQKIRHIAPLSG